MTGHHPLADDSEDFYAQLQQPQSGAASAASGTPGAAQQPTSLGDGIEDLRQLAKRGAWGELLDRTRAGAATASQPAEGRARGGASASGGVAPLMAAAYHVTALASLRQWGAITELLHGIDTDSAETPFALRWWAAELPARSGDPAAAIAAHCRLLDECVRQVPPAPADDIDFSGLAGSGPSDELAGDDFEPGSSPDAATWARRAASVAGAVAAHHARAQEWTTALRWMQWLLQRRPTDAHVMSQTGYLMLSMGDVAGAQAMFEHAVSRPQAGKGLVARNAGLMLFAQQDFPGALTEFEAAAAADPADASAVNNAAICKLLAVQARAAVQGLEVALRDRHAEMLTEGSAGTMSRLYELGPPAGVASAKRRLADFCARTGPEGFDAAALLV